MSARQPGTGKSQGRSVRDAVSRRVAPGGVAASEIAAEEGDEDEPIFGRRQAGERWRRFPRVTLALSAFIMSLVVTLISAYYALQGPEVLVRPPQQVLLYRDGEGDRSILGFGIRLDMINGASDYGDVMLEAELSPAGSDVSFKFQNVLRPVFTGGSTKAESDCELGSRCIDLPGLLLIEQPDTLVDLPGGSAKAMHLSFPAAQWNCSGSPQACARYATFDSASAALASRPLDIRMTLKFNRDGQRRIRCRGGKIDLAYLRKLGWMTLACEQSEVTGGPWL